jgi:hypothetical protein
MFGKFSSQTTGFKIGSDPMIHRLEKLCGVWWKKNDFYICKKVV